MKKIFGCIGLVLVLSVFGSIQTAAAFDRGAKDNRITREPQNSHGERSPRGGSDSGFREERDHREIRNQPPAHHYERRLPAGYRTLKLANMILYYLNGMFYQSTPFGYEVVNAPMGAVVGQLPPGYYQIFYNGTMYYVYNNTYYVQGPMGYNIVPPPSQAVMLPVRAGW